MMPVWLFCYNISIIVEKINKVFFDLAEQNCNLELNIGKIVKFALLSMYVFVNEAQI